MVENQIDQVYSSGLSVDIDLAPEVLWSIWALLILVFIIMYFVLSYHWKKYGVEGNQRIFAKPLFWIVSFLLLIIMAFAVTGF